MKLQTLVPQNRDLRQPAKRLYLDDSIIINHRAEANMAISRRRNSETPLIKLHRNKNHAHKLY